MFSKITQLNQVIRLIKPHTQLLIILLVAILTAITHGYNVFNFPTLWDDEAFYSAQSWAVTNSGNLSFYTYWYDHTPIGWIFLGLWNVLTKGLISTVIPYSSALLHGRLFILILNIISGVFVYKISCLLVKRRFVALITTVFFIASPLAIFFHRQIYLDNIMVFWLLPSIYFILKGRTLSNYLLSSVFFSVAVLSKESAIVFLPIFLLILFRKSSRHNRFFAISSWLSIFVLLISLYPIYALVKGELFPFGTIFGGATPHVSLLDALLFQSGRGGEFFLYEGSKFQQTFAELWFNLDPFYVVAGWFATLINIIIYRKHTWAVYLSAFSIFYSIYLVRSIALDFYIIPLLPIFCFNLAISVDYFLDFIDKKLLIKESDNQESQRSQKTLSIILQSSISILVVTIVLVQTQLHSYIYTSNQTVNLMKGLAWVRENISKKSLVVGDMSSFADVNYQIKSIDETNLHSFWVVKSDPAIRDTIFKKDWKNIDYLLVTKAFLANSKNTFNTANNGLGIVDEALENSRLIKSFKENTDPNIRLLNGNFDILEVQNKDVILKNSWEYYKTNFIKDGQVIDLETGVTTSEGQSYALLRSVWMDDQTEYDKVYSWLANNLSLPETSLIPWKYGTNQEVTNTILDSNNATDGDLDTALSLIMAYKKWGQERYLKYATELIQDIYKDCVIQLNGVDYLLPSALDKQNFLKSESRDSLLLNPSYFSPAIYKIFSQYDAANQWLKLRDDTYKTLEQMKLSPEGRVQLPSNWIYYNPNNNLYSSAIKYNQDANLYSYDAFRVFWRVSLDKIWFNSETAQKYLESYGPLIKNQWNQNKLIPTVSKLSGQSVTNYSAPSVSTGYLSAMIALNMEEQYEIYLNTIEQTMSSKEYWGRQKSYYDQNWGWFITALYSSNLPSPDSIAPSFPKEN